MIVPIVCESEWLDRLGHLPRWQPPATKTLVISPHPDDETLGAGGVIAYLRSQGAQVIVAAVTDGENAYLDLDSAPSLGETREQEQTAALACLGVDAAQIHRLRLPDSSVTPCEPELVELLKPLVSDSMHVIAPWPKDFHPDHEACGRAAEAVAREKKARLTFYFFWTWHRGTVDDIDQLALVSFPLPPEVLRVKHEALQCHRSQLEHKSGFPILPRDLLDPMDRPFEVFLPA